MQRRRRSQWGARDDAARLTMPISAVRDGTVTTRLRQCDFA